MDILIELLVCEYSYTAVSFTPTFVTVKLFWYGCHRDKFPQNFEYFSWICHREVFNRLYWADIAWYSVLIRNSIFPDQNENDLSRSSSLVKCGSVKESDNLTPDTARHTLPGQGNRSPSRTDYLGCHTILIWYTVALKVDPIFPRKIIVKLCNLVCPLNWLDELVCTAVVEGE